MAKLHRQFLMVRCSDKGTAQEIKPKSIPEMIFLDGDSEEFYRAPVRTAPNVEAAFKEALKRYASKDISWASGEVENAIEDAGGAKKPVILLFANDKKDSAKLITYFQDRWMVKHHDKVVFVRVEFDRKSPVCKEWGVTGAPTAVFVNPLEEDAKKRVMDKLRGKSNLRSVKTFLVKNLAKFQQILEEK